MTSKFSPWILLIGLSCLSLVLFVACDADDDDSADDDDDAAGIEIEETFPQDGASDFYYRYNVWVEFSDEVSNASITLTDAGGTEITGDSSMNDNNTELTFNPYGSAEGDHLDPSAAYTATISWDDHADVPLNFQTSAIGTPAGDPASDIVGQDYFLDLGTAEFTEPPGVGGILSQYIADVYVIFHIAAIDEGAGTIDVFGGIVDKDGSDYVQDLCTETLPMTAEEPGTWDNPYMQIGPTDFELAIEGYEATIDDLMIGGAFSSDGSMMVGGTFDGKMDTRVLDDLIDPDAEEGAACELLSSLGIECEECAGGGAFCLTVSAHSIVSEKVSITGIDPGTGGVTEGLTLVTADDVAAWVASGDCDPPE
jgi:Bacterial Ig-like domain